jgi:hypothetical protein
MPRRMSFALTEADLVEGRKDVTRRLGWLDTREGETIIAVRKCMGLRKGERQVVLGTVVVRRVSRERLDTITAAEVRREGFAELTADEFIGFFCGTNRCEPSTVVTRIEFTFTRERDRQPHGT